MYTLSDSFVKEHVKGWITAWNNKDLDKVLLLFTDDIIFYSPKIKTIFPELNSQKIDNKKDLERYWLAALKQFDNLYFLTIDYYIKNNICVLEYLATFDRQTKFLSIEKSEFNNDDLIYKASAFYGPQLEMI